MFQTYDAGDSGRDNPIGTPMAACMSMFLMSLSYFETVYEGMSRTNHEIEAKILFVIYIAIANILLINMLIAMMGNTYQKIAETRNEWQRQVRRRTPSPRDIFDRRTAFFFFDDVDSGPGSCWSWREASTPRSASNCRNSTRRGCTTAKRPSSCARPNR